MISEALTGWNSQLSAGLRQLGPRSSILGLGGLAACIVVLATAFLLPSPAAARAWLAAAFLWSSVPIGSLMILMMMRLIPGAWNNEMMLSTEAGALLLPLAALAFVPVLVAIGTLYPWVHLVQTTVFRAAYLTSGTFVLRTIVWFGALGVLTGLLITRRLWSVSISSVGLIVFAIGGTVITTDWVMSLDPDFRSSGFGLYAMSVQVTVAMAVAVVVAVSASGPHLRKPWVLGALLLTSLLFWAYFSYMQFVVIWSSDFPPLIRWYLHRASGGWGALFWALAILHALVIAILILPPMLSSPLVLKWAAVLVLLGKAMESAWLVLPSGGQPLRLLDAVYFLTALGGLGALSTVLFGIAFRARIDARRPKPERRIALA